MELGQWQVPALGFSRGSDCVWVHCSIHREALAVKNIPSLLCSTLQGCLKFINYIKSRPLNFRIYCFVQRIRK
jgi:hypothetical protein